MKKMFLLVLTASFVFFACSHHGKKLKINNTSNVFYKGDEVNEADAKNLGDFLLKQGYFTTTDERSVQLIKDGNAYIVKFVIDEERLSQDSSTILAGFRVWQMWLQDDVFSGAETKLILADAELKDIHDVDAFTAKERAEMNSTPPGAVTSSQLSSDIANLDTSVNADTQKDRTNE